MNCSIKSSACRCAALCALLIIGAMDTTAEATSPSQAPPGYSLTGTGSKTDFDFLAGAWTTRQRRLKERGVGSSEWKDSPANVHCATQYLDGAVIAEKSYSPAKTVSG